MSPSGRRPGDSGTRETILGAAREAFGSKGFDATSLRSIARTAGVDPGLVTHYFGSKDGLFDAALALPIDPGELVPFLLSEGVEGLGERIVLTFLDVWDSTPGQGPMLAMLRSAASHEDSAAHLRQMLTRVLLTPLAVGAGAGSYELRAALLASQVVGLAVARYVLKLEPLASAPPDQVAALLGPTLQRYLTGTLA